ncbi:sensor histidine kinase [Paenibacillus wynnii]|uniref:histidine kinase n=1 Tax=Paenibacillus wynnii TaxID=268407 RepID=A0A098M6R6_9BACL|nr:HAMP domain-containing sensor histidine kinase [Paenibacillus wynnii]KGE17706.1 histidine kinase [Paenibacillus wynnii]
MKLVHQINLAFASVLLVVLTGSAVIIHYVLLDHFMGAKAEEMQSIGSVMTASLNREAVKGTTAEGVIALTPVSIVAPAKGVEAIITDKTGNVLSSSVAASPNVIASEISEWAQAEYSRPLSTDLTNLWEGKDNRFIVAVNPISQGMLTLISPVSRIKEIEQELLKQLLMVICLGGAMMFLLSLLITRKLIKPLMSLKEELKKVKTRHYSEVQLIPAGGEIGTVAEAVYDLARDMDKYSHVQKQFFQNASHELKTPLMSISGYAEGIRDGIFEGESVHKGLDIILSESGRLKNIITEMTLLAKLDSEEDIFRPVEVCIQDILTESIERVNPLLVKKGLELQIEYSAGESQQLMIRADQDKLLQALLNVVVNATRYAKKQICIQAGKNNDRIEIIITDDGTGIPEDVFPYLFHRFVKGKDGDTGLGLAISRAIVERCGGLITAGNSSRGGAVISFSFPSIL